MYKSKITFNILLMRTKINKGGREKFRKTLHAYGSKVYDQKHSSELKEIEQTRKEGS